MCRPARCLLVALGMWLHGSITAEERAPAPPDPVVTEFLVHAARSIPPGDASWVDPFVGESRVVLVGEETHGIAEHIALKAEIAARLLERHGFTHVLIEDDVFKADSLDANLRRPSPTPAASHFRRFFWCWNVSEMHALFDGLAAAGLRPRVGGVDVQTARFALLALRAHASSSAQRTVVDSLDALFALDRETYALRTDEEKAADAAYVEGLTGTFAPVDVDRALRHARRVLAVRAGGDAHGPRMKARDRGMAESVLDVLAENPAHRAIVFAHNAHAGYADFYESFTGGVVPLARHLRDEGVETLSIGAVFTSGRRLLDPRSRDDGEPAAQEEVSPGTQAAHWASIPHDRWLLDLRALADEARTGAVDTFFSESPSGYFNNYGPARPLGTTYDLLVGYRTISPATPVD